MGFVRRAVQSGGGGGRGRGGACNKISYNFEFKIVCHNDLPEVRTNVLEISVAVEKNISGTTYIQTDQK